MNLKDRVVIGFFIVLLMVGYAYADGCIMNESGAVLLGHEGSTSSVVACDRTAKVIIIASTPTPTPTPTSTPG